MLDTSSIELPDHSLCDSALVLFLVFLFDSRLFSSGNTTLRAKPELVIHCWSPVWSRLYNLTCVQTSCDQTNESPNKPHTLHTHYCFSMASPTRTKCSLKLKYYLDFSTSHLNMIELSILSRKGKSQLDFYCGGMCLKFECRDVFWGIL